MYKKPDELATNEELMGRIRVGDKHAFEVLVNRHQRPVLNFIFRFMGNRTDAEDLTQDVFLNVWKSVGNYRAAAKFTTWLYRIATNLCINRQRANRIRRLFFRSQLQEPIQDPKGSSISGEGAERLSPEDDLIQSELSQHVRKALGELPTSQRLAVILKIYDELSYHEISQILDRSVSAVDSLLIRAKKNLRKKLIQKK